MGGSVPKQFLPVAGTEILVRTICKFLDALRDPEIMVVLPEADMERWGEIASRNGLAGRHRVCAGGATRFESVRNGLIALEESRAQYIAVHDGVRPLLSEDMITRCMECAEKHGTAVPVVEPVDSFRMDGPYGYEVVNRASLRAVQTPQVFLADIIRTAYVYDYSPAFTDDASVVEYSGEKLAFCDGERRNIKITTHDDLLFAEAVIRSGEL